MASPSEESSSSVALGGRIAEDGALGDSCNSSSVSEESASQYQPIQVVPSSSGSQNRLEKGRGSYQESGTDTLPKEDRWLPHNPPVPGDPPALRPVGAPIRFHTPLAPAVAVASPSTAPSPPPQQQQQQQQQQMDAGGAGMPTSSSSDLLQALLDIAHAEDDHFYN